jgi:DNA-binding NarL/FixJ family response regulator
MVMGRPKAALVLSPEQRRQLEGMASSRSLPAGPVTRVRIILLSASGKTNQQIARQLGLSSPTVGKWRRQVSGFSRARVGPRVCAGTDP